MRVLILALLFLPLSAWTQEYRKCPDFNLEENWENSDSFVKNEKVIYYDNDVATVWSCECSDW